ncbi:hypothetical protein [Salegentibacter mishustinae]|uniref:hypothetical protein n=1 Tax=Salegentibacter mishustinae TaxID=270918 RepID=UPI00248F92A1|nr:hypothetical protein [Salegentibacter mishustinae]
MSKIKHSDEELKKIFKNKSKSEQHVQYFVKKYKEVYVDVEDGDGFLEEGEILKDAVLKYTLEFYLDKVLSLTKNGHTPEWADHNADHLESEEVAVGEAYMKLKKQDPIAAKKQIGIYCKSLGKNDPLFTEYYTYLLDEHEPYDAVEYSENYVKAYRKKITEGKSEIFAKAYAETKSTDRYTDFYCTIRAESYEDAINDGKSENYAWIYSDKYGQMIVNHYSSSSEIENDEYYDYLHQKVLDEVCNIK